MSPKRVIRAGAKLYGFTPAEIRGRGRRAGLSLARQHVVLTLREPTTRSYSEIGALLDGRDHTTIMHAHTRARERGLLPIPVAPRTRGRRRHRERIKELRGQLRAALLRCSELEGALARRAIPAAPAGRLNGALR